MLEMPLDVLGCRNMQTSGIVRLNQLTGHQQLLQRFGTRCPSSLHSCQQQRPRPSVVMGSIRHKQQLVAHDFIGNNNTGLHGARKIYSSGNPAAFRFQHTQPAATTSTTPNISISSQSKLRVSIPSNRSQQSNAMAFAPVQPATATAIRPQPTATATAIAPLPKQNFSSATPVTASATISSIMSNRTTSQAQQQAQVFDPSALPIADRVSLLRHRIIARTRPRRQPGAARAHEGEKARQVLAVCNAAGVGTAAANYMVDHVVKARIRQDSLSHYLSSYVKLAGLYGSPVALQWLRRVPSVIRHAADVPARLRQLQLLMSAGGQHEGGLQEVLELTRRCPQVLGVDAALIAPRAQAICNLLGRPHTSASDILTAAPALLCMSHSTLAAKVAQLQGLAASNTFWAETFADSSTGSLAVLLTYSMQRYNRLQYIQDRGFAGSMGIATALALSDDKMLERYPDYEGWRQQQQQQQQQKEVGDGEEEQQRQQESVVQQSAEGAEVPESA